MKITEFRRNIFCVFLLSAFLNPAFCVTDGCKGEDLQDVAVGPKDTLWSIADTYLKNPRQWSEIVRCNPDKISQSNPIAVPGQVLKVPKKLIKDEYREAKLASYLNEVLFKKRNAVQWKKVFKQMDMYKNDTLKTGTDAYAEVKFYSGELFNLYPNSMADLRPPQKGVDVHLRVGEMKGLRTTVITPTAKIVPKTKNTEFGAKINDDLSTRVQVYKGKAEVEAQGKKVLVAEGFGTEVKFDMPPSKATPLPPLPEFEKGAGPQVAKASAGPQVKFEGNVISIGLAKTGAVTGPGRTTVSAGTVRPVPDMKAPDAIDADRINLEKMTQMITVATPIQGYRVQAARDSGFANLVLDKRYDVFDRINLNEMLPKGNYWVRISYIDLLGFEGKFSEPRQITVR
ncbi:MAG: LysM peptidoglycan-binding domain-containing protein [Elusimicrobia bacterium]|nr:LysM peptidoglycan-binding domain-containing protein [Elusimicrobiota bacterium]